MFRLGPEGQEIFDQMNRNDPKSTNATYRRQIISNENGQDVEIDYMINQLLSPNPAITAKQVLLNVAYYLPLMKNEAQISRTITAILESPLFFSNNGTVVRFDDAYLIIEAINVSFEKKIIISTPTVSLTTFYNRVLGSIIGTNVSPNSSFLPLMANLLKKNILIAGVMLSKNTLDEYMIPEQSIFFKNFDKVVFNVLVENFNKIVDINQRNVSQDLYNIKALNLLALACVFPLFNQNKYAHYKGEIHYPNICQFGLNLLFNSQYGFQNGELFRIDFDNSNSVKVAMADLKQRPVFKHLNKLSFLIRNAILESGTLTSIQLFQILESSSSLILSFSSHLHSIHNINNAKFLTQPSPQFHSQLDLQQYWEILKQIMFSAVIIFQGFADLALSSNSLNQQSGIAFSIISSLFSTMASRDVQRQSFHLISVNMLKTLYWLHFIVDRIGAGGFQAYKYVYLCATELLFETSSPASGATTHIEPQALSAGENLSDFFINNISFKDLINDEVDRAKLVFLLGYWETLALVCSPYYYDSVIMPLTSEFINRPYRTVNFDKVVTTRNIVESSHSVKLSSFKLERLAQYNSRHLISYVDILLHQFPLVLSSHQLILAISVLATYLHKDGVIGKHNSGLQHVFLTKVFARMLAETPGRKIVDLQPKSVSPDLGDFSSGKDEAIPSTLRAAFMVAFVKTVPYIETGTLLYWLEKLYTQISKKSTLEERQFCEKALWNTISNELGLSKADIAIEWWYNRDNYSTPRL